MSNGLSSPRLERLEKILAVIKPLEGRKTYKVYADALEKAGIRAGYYDSAAHKAFWANAGVEHHQRETFYIRRPEELVPEVERYVTGERNYVQEHSNPAYHVDWIRRYCENRVLSQMESETRQTECATVREAREKALAAVRKALREIRV